MRRVHTFGSIESIHSGREISSPLWRLLWYAPLAVALLCSTAQTQESPNTFTFVDDSGEKVTLKLIGPTHGYISVPNRAQNTVHVAAGRYTIVGRYCDRSKYCSNKKSDASDVIHMATQYSKITITLNLVPDGNYHTTPASAAEFWGGDTDHGLHSERNSNVA